MRALITAGGTSEPIDDVRVVTNLSTGRFGAAIANALVRRGVDVTILAGPALLARRPLLDDRVTCVPFGPDGSFADLQRTLETHTDPAPDLLFMAAAVSDYSPVRSHGKIRSTDDRLVIEMTKNPKLLTTLRERCGPATWLVGFKLLSQVTTAELVRVAQGQITAADLDLTVANDAATFAPGRHPVVLVHADGTVSEHTGDKAQMAEVVVEAAIAGWMARSAVNTPSTAAFSDALVWPGPTPAWVDTVARGSGWTHALWVPRVWRVFTAPGNALDGSVEAATERVLDDALHGVVRRDAFHCDAPSARFILPLPARGSWCVGEPSPVLQVQWQAIQSQFRAWLDQTTAPPVRSLEPVVHRGQVIGVQATVDLDGPAWVGFLAASHRNRGLGDLLARGIALLEDARVWAPDADTHSFWVDRGFTADGDHTLVRHPELRHAASVALVHLRTHEVLLGRRLLGSYPDHWAFPGGGVDAGESSTEAAARELHEETTVVLPPGRWSMHTPITVGDGTRAWRLDNHVYLTVERPEPTRTAELDARWIALDDALSLRPMASGTRTVLRRIRQLLTATPAPRR